MVGSSERRVFERFPAILNRTRLEWCDGAENRNATARLLNVSQGGALIETTMPLPAAQGFWLRLEEPSFSTWVGARLIRNETDARAAIAFHQPCPFDFLESARQGISLENLALLTFS